MERYTPQMIRAILRGLRDHYRKAKLEPEGFRADHTNVTDRDVWNFRSHRSLEPLEVGPNLDEQHQRFTARRWTGSRPRASGSSMM